MLLATHSIVAATAGEAIGSPILAFLVGVIIHYALDAIPHFDTTDEGKLTKRQLFLIGIDGIIGAVLIFRMYPGSSHHAAFIAGIIGGILPDILFNLPGLERYISKIKLAIGPRAFHALIQKYTLPPISGLLVQAIIICAALYIYYAHVI